MDAKANIENTAEFFPAEIKRAEQQVAKEKAKVEGGFKALEAKVESEVKKL